MAQVRPPTLVLLPSATLPGSGLLASALLHGAITSVLIWLWVLAPKGPVIMAHKAEDALREPGYHVLTFPLVIRIGDASLLGDVDRGPRPPALEPDFAGPRKIVSNMPDATNHVQTIRRPDLVAPPKLTSPVRLQTMVTLPAPPGSVSPAPQLEPQVPPSAEELPTLPASERGAQFPPLLVAAPTVSQVASVERVVPKDIGTDLEASGPETILVLDAVSVPPEPVPIIPDAELSAHFIVAPWTEAGRANVGPRDADEKLAAPGASSATEHSSQLIPESEKGTIGLQPGARGTDAVAENEGRAGITILGGSRGSSARTVAAGSIPRGSPYALTIISGGTSGGAARDFGVFSRKDVVYTAYIPMTDAGGGPDWSIQYALASSASAGNGLLTPPVALRKVAARGPRIDDSENAGPLFVTGVIDELGRLQGLQAVRSADRRAAPALNALAQWEFLPARLDGKPVASKVLIGVSVMPAEEVGNVK